MEEYKLELKQIVDYNITVPFQKKQGVMIRTVLVNFFLLCHLFVLPMGNSSDWLSDVALITLLLGNFVTILGKFLRK